MMRNSSGWFPAESVAVLCAAIALQSASTAPGAQSTSGSDARTISAPSGTVIPGAAARMTSAYRYFTYPNIELWSSAGGGGSRIKVAPIAAWITGHQKATQGEYVIKEKYLGIKDFVGRPDYTWKSENITDPDVTEPLARMGLRVDIREGGGFTIFVAPEKVLADRTHRVPILYVPYVLDRKDVFWAMNMLVHFRKYNELCAQRGDFIIIYVLVEKSAAGRGDGVSSVLVDTANDAYRGDYKRLYLDMSAFAENGARVADVAGLDWSDDDGMKRDPDAAIEHLGFIPVLNVAGKWTGKPGGGGFGGGDNANPYFDGQRLVHGMLGEHRMEGVSFARNAGKDDDPAVKAHFERMGLVFSQHEYQGERWLMFSPRQAVEKT